MSAVAQAVRLIFAAAALVCLASGASRPAGASDLPEQRDPPVRDAGVPAEALRFGAALEEQASPELKKWVQSFVAKQMRDRAVDAKGTMAVVDNRYPEASDEARDAATFLLFFTAYKDEEGNEKMLVIRIREIDRETIELTRQIQQLWKDEENRSALPTKSLTMQQRLRIEQEVQSREAKLREYADERQLKSTRLAASRKKVQTYLRLLAVAHDRMKGIDPSIVRGLQ